jgi:transaldolase
MTRTTPTRYFNDSSAEAELRYAIERGAIGATSNPVIALGVLKKEMARWQPVLRSLVEANPSFHERDIAWQLYTQMARSSAALLEPVFAANNSTWGRLSAQIDPTLHNQPEAMLRQAVEIAAMAPNMQVKTPCTSAGVSIIEEATFRGVNLNVTVSFSVPQVLVIAEAIEAGLCRRDAAGLDTAHMAPVATLMMGRLDDWLKVLAARGEHRIDPAVLDWAGISAVKRASHLFAERGYRTTLLSAAYRHLGHWSEIIGGNLVQTMPHEWQAKANRSHIVPVSRIDEPLDPEIISALQTIPDFVRAYEPAGMTPAEFDTFGPTRRTLRSFIASWYEFVSLVRDVMVPDPDVAPSPQP